VRPATEWRITLAAEHGVPAERTDAVLDRRVREEEQDVTAYLRDVLRPDPEILEPLTELSREYILAVVSSRALSREAGVGVVVSSWRDCGTMTR
jgi:hypothetical protein